jgi:hypothetical protein
MAASCRECGLAMPDRKQIILTLLFMISIVCLRANAQQSGLSSLAGTQIQIEIQSFIINVNHSAIDFTNNQS